MLRILSLFLIAAVGNGFYNVQSNNEFDLFLNFQEKYNKRYESVETFTKRFQVFRSNLRDIIAHNLNTTHDFRLGVNKFSDLTSSEFKHLYVSGFNGQKGSCQPFLSRGTPIKESIDWRKLGVVNPVRDQGQCGSCWAFATVANAESWWAIQKGELLDLSEQEIVDCATGLGYWNMGCNGGNPDSSFKYMINNGICDEIADPYFSGTTTKEGECKSCNEVASFSACYDVKSNDQLALKEAVNINPVVVAIEADTFYFQSYSSGILTDAKCGTTLDHAVEIVGYGRDNGIDYWTVRNSWSADWGEDGYVRIKRTNSTNDIGVCGISAEPSFIEV